MGVQFILGRAGVGKTHACLAAVGSALTESTPGPLLLIVPEQASAATERALAGVAPRGGYMNAEVLSFSRLARRIFAQAGKNPTFLPRTARRLALHHLLRTLRDELPTLRRTADTAGLVRELDALFTQLVREGLTSERLRAASTAASAGAGARLDDLARLFAAYETWLGPERIDPDAVLPAVRDALDALDWLPQARVWLDGFAGFTGEEQATVVALAQRVRELHITLLLDPDRSAVRDDLSPTSIDLFSPIEQTYYRLRRALRAAHVAPLAERVLTPASNPRFRAAGLAQLEVALAAPQSTPAGSGPAAPDDGSVRVVACPSHRAELRAAARWIRRMMIDCAGALRFRDFALVARDLEPIAHLVSEVLDAYEIPHFIDRRRPLGAHALVRLVRALFDAAVEHVSAGSMADLLQTGLTPMPDRDAELLRLVVLQAGFAGREDWMSGAAAALGEMDRRRLRRVRQKEFERLDRLRFQLFACLQQWVGPSAAGLSRSGREWVVQLYETVSSLRVPERLRSWIRRARAAGDWESAEVHRLAWDAFCETLDEIAVVLADVSLSAAEAARLVVDALESRTVGVAPPTLDEVLVGSIERSRHPDIRHTWLLAFNDGIFPPPPTESALFAREDAPMLQELGLPQARAAADEIAGERLLAYVACTRPSQSLVVSYAAADELGEPLQPSLLLADFFAARPGLRTDAMAPGQSDADEPVVLEEVAEQYFAARSAPPEAPPGDLARLVALRQRLERNLYLESEMRPLFAGETYANTPSAVGAYVAVRSEAPDVCWTPSPREVNEYIQCPFRHFAAYGLGLPSSERAVVPGRELGSFSHALLAAVVERARGRTLREIAASDWLEWVDAEAATMLESLPTAVRRRRPELAALVAFAAEGVKPTIRMQAARWQAGDTGPIATELELSAVLTARVPVDGGRFVQLHGRIDRLDAVADTPSALLFDYKTRTRKLNRDYMTQEQLQLFLYALALEASPLEGRRYRLDGMFLVPLFPALADSKSRKRVPAAYEEKLRLMPYRPTGIAVESIVPRLDRDLGGLVSPVLNARLTQKGTFEKRGDVVPDHVLRQRLAQVDATLRQAAAGIVEGAIDVAPLREDRTLACRTCSYRPVCRFDRAYNRIRPVELTLPAITTDDTSASTAEGSAWT